MTMTIPMTMTVDVNEKTPFRSLFCLRFPLFGFLPHVERALARSGVAF